MLKISYRSAEGQAGTPKKKDLEKTLDKYKIEKV